VLATLPTYHGMVWSLNYSLCPFCPSQHHTLVTKPYTTCTRIILSSSHSPGSLLQPQCHWQPGAHPGYPGAWTQRQCFLAPQDSTALALFHCFKSLSRALYNPRAIGNPGHTLGTQGALDPEAVLSGSAASTFQVWEEPRHQGLSQAQESVQKQKGEGREESGQMHKRTEAQGKGRSTRKRAEAQDERGRRGEAGGGGARGSREPSPGAVSRPASPPPDSSALAILRSESAQHAVVRFRLISMPAWWWPRRTGGTLTVHCWHTGGTLVVHWRYTGRTLAVHWSYTGGTLMVQWRHKRCNYGTLVVDKRCTDGTLLVDWWPRRRVAEAPCQFWSPSH